MKASKTFRVLILCSHPIVSRNIIVCLLVFHSRLVQAWRRDFCFHLIGLVGNYAYRDSHGSKEQGIPWPLLREKSWFGSLVGRAQGRIDLSKRGLVHLPPNAWHDPHSQQIRRGAYIGRDWGIKYPHFLLGLHHPTFLASKPIRNFPTLTQNWFSSSFIHTTTGPRQQVEYCGEQSPKIRRESI